MNDNNSPNSDNGAPIRARGNWSDLSLRLLSALVLGTVALVLACHSCGSFTILVALGGVVLSWEWARLVRGGAIDELLVLHALSILIACGLGLYGEFQTALLLLLVGPALKFAIADDKTAAHLGLSLLGVPYIGLPALALIWLRSDVHFGWYAVLFLFLTVWSVDVFAYLSGRAIGGPKLAPRISPKKTWAGLIGGVLAGTLGGGLFALAIGGTDPFKLALVSLVVAIASQIGDLTESAFKRQFGIKDASNLIPGHGGLLDRVDGLMFGALVAALIALAFGGGAEPGRALLIWSSGL